MRALQPLLRLARPLVRATHSQPELFSQTIVLSNGATFIIKTTSPRKTVRLNKDLRNHPLWNPSLDAAGVSEESEQIARFSKRFGDVGDLGDMGLLESGEAVSAQLKRAIQDMNKAPKKKGGKGKK